MIIVDFFQKNFIKFYIGFLYGVLLIRNIDQKKEKTMSSKNINILQFWFPFSVSEWKDDLVQNKKYILYRLDPLFSILFVWPMTFFCLGVIPTAYWAVFYPSGFKITLALFTSAMGLIGLLTWNATRRVAGDVRAVRQIFDREKFFERCMVVAPKSFASYLEFPGGFQEWITPSKEEKGAIIVQLRQFDNSLNEDSETSQTDEQYIQLFVQGRLAVEEALLTVYLSLREDFALREEDNGSIDNAMERGLRTGVLEKMKMVLQGMIDSVLQKYSVGDMLTNVSAIQTDLLQPPADKDAYRKDSIPQEGGVLQWALMRSGIVLTNVGVIDTQDTKPEGFIAQRSRSVRAVRDSKQRIISAKAERDARVTEASKSANAAIFEAQQRKNVLKKQRSVLEEEKINEQIASLIRLMDTVAMQERYKENPSLFVAEVIRRVSTTEDTALLGILQSIAEVFVVPGARTTGAFVSNENAGDSQNPFLQAAAMLFPALQKKEETSEEE